MLPRRAGKIRIGFLFLLWMFKQWILDLGVKTGKFQCLALYKGKIKSVRSLYRPRKRREKQEKGGWRLWLLSPENVINTGYRLNFYCRLKMGESCQHCTDTRAKDREPKAWDESWLKGLITSEENIPSNGVVVCCRPKTRNQHTALCVIYLPFFFRFFLSVILCRGT